MKNQSLVTLLCILLSTPLNSIICQENQNSILWSVEDSSMSIRSFILGSIHTMDTTMIHFPVAQIESIISQSSVAFFETSFREFGPIPKESLKPELIINNDPELDIRKHLNSLQLSKLLMVFDSSKMYPGMNAILHRIKPQVLAFFVVSESQLKSSYFIASNFSPDYYFASFASKIGKPVMGLEDNKAQIGWILNPDLSFEDGLAFLVQSLEDADEKSKDIFTPYVNQDLTSYLSLANIPMNVSRQLNMAKKLGDVMKTKSTFVCVGVAHLPGPNGILDLLKNKGFIVRPLDFELSSSK